MTGPSDARWHHLDPALTAVVRERRQLVSGVYGLLGALPDADDAVEETHARWYAFDVGSAAADRVPEAHELR